MKASVLALHLLSLGLNLVVGRSGKLVVSPASRLDDELRASIMTHKAELLDWARESANDSAESSTELPPLTLDEVTRVRSWDDAEIAMAERYMDLARHHRLGEAQAYLLSDHLVLRDRSGAGHRMCVECCHLNQDGLCSAATIGLLHGAPAVFEPKPLAFRTCPTFVAAVPATPVSRRAT